MTAGLFVLCIVFIVACASRPTLAPNEKFNHVGDAGARDVAECASLADEHLRQARGASSLSRVVDVAVGPLGAEDQPGTEARRKIISYCLRKRGYVVTGWN